MERLDYLETLLENAVGVVEPLKIKGKVLEVTGTIVKAYIPRVRIGEICSLRDPVDEKELLAEVVGFSRAAALLTPLGDIRGLTSSTEVIPTGRMLSVPVGPGLLGRVLDGLGRPADDKGPVEAVAQYPVVAAPPKPMSRKLITRPVPLGLRVLDGLITCGEGQRLGLFAAAGVGKSTTLAMITRNASVDVTVLALIGERGREVREFIENDLGPAGMQKAVVVVSTSDRPSMERLKAAHTATAVAEYFRDQGLRVLLLMDSVTRFARAMREIGLAAGEPPTRRGFPPSVFTALPQLMERAGQSDRGSITALYTVLVEGDDTTEPVADETRSILDGHIILSRELAAANHYPAVDVLESLSRVMHAVVSKEHRQAAGKMRDLLAKYKEVELLLRIGEYQSGSDPATDEAVAKHERINAFLRQGLHEVQGFDETVQALLAAVAS